MTDHHTNDATTPRADWPAEWAKVRLAYERLQERLNPGRKFVGLLATEESQQILACRRVKARTVWDRLPRHYIEALEQNQMILSCCRHPEDHDVALWFTSRADADKGVPDIIKFYCTCGRVHRRVCVGSGDARPIWDAR